MDPIEQFKDNQRKAWATFTPFESITGIAAAQQLRFVAPQEGKKLLDVACGTGVLALTAARDAKVRVTGVDLTPELIERASANTKIMGLEASWHVGDAEALPFADGTFDYVVSQFGHMFAPRPDVATKELLRVLKPGGTLAFSTWPPELLTGRIFGALAKYSPPPPPGVSPPVQWGDPNIVRERLGSAVRDLVFDRGVINFPTLSPSHFRIFGEENLGPMIRLMSSLSAEPEKLAALRREYDEMVAPYFQNNYVRQDFLMTRAIKA